MSHFYHLEFYVPKRRPTNPDVLRAIDVMSQKDMHLHIDETHPPLFGDPSVFVMTPKEAARRPPKEVIGLLAREGGSVWFEGGKAETLSFQMRIYPNGTPEALTKAKEFRSGETGVPPLGSLDLRWLFSIDDKARSRMYFAKTIAVGLSLYRAFQPLFGHSYLEEGSYPQYYNLIPTEKNIMEQGPRDLSPINFWSPTILNKLECDWARLASHAGLSASVLGDGGILLHCTPEEFAENGAVDKRERGERLLGWRQRSLTPNRW